MRVIRAHELGMCFGVRDALEMARQIPQPHNVAMHGQLVHNPLVLTQLRELGFQETPESEREELPPSPDILITAHGISHRERDRLLNAGKSLIDATCPLVRRVHLAARQLADQGYHVVVIGRRGHVEVRGIVEDLPEFTVVESPDEVRPWPHARLAVICQTTTPPRIAAAVLQEIEFQHPGQEVRFVNTICQPTLDRQLAVEQLCLEADVIVVVGGPNSNNTRQLLELACECGVRAQQVQSASDLRPDWFVNCSLVGLTAGTSTLPETVDEVEAALHALSPVPQTQQESIHVA